MSRATPETLAHVTTIDAIPAEGARERPDALALVVGEREISFAEWETLVADGAARLAQAGLRPGRPLRHPRRERARDLRPHPGRSARRGLAGHPQCAPVRPRGRDDHRACRSAPDRICQRHLPRRRTPCGRFRDGVCRLSRPAAVPSDGRRRLRTGAGPWRPGARCRRDDLHVGHHRRTQGGDAQPRQPHACGAQFRLSARPRTRRPGLRLPAGQPTSSASLRSSSARRSTARRTTWSRASTPRKRCACFATKG